MGVRAVAFDGHGVVYHRPRPVIDVLIDSFKLGDHRRARELYCSLQERAFTGEISYTKMVSEFCKAFSLPSEQVDEIIQKASASVEPEPGLGEVLQYLYERKIIIGMITNSIHPEPIKREWLRKLNVEHFFAVIISSVDVGVRKPDPEIYFRFSSKVSLPPNNILFVGHDEKEIRGAKYVGMLTAGLRCFTAHADFHISSLPELLSLPLWSN